MMASIFYLQISLIFDCVFVSSSQDFDSGFGDGNEMVLGSSLGFLKIWS